MEEHFRESHKHQIAQCSSEIFVPSLWEKKLKVPIEVHCIDDMQDTYALSTHLKNSLGLPYFPSQVWHKKFGTQRCEDKKKLASAMPLTNASKQKTESKRTVFTSLNIGMTINHSFHVSIIQPHFRQRLLSNIYSFIGAR